EADDASAQQRGHVDSVEAFRHGIGEIGAARRVFGIPSIDCVAGEDGMLAEVLHGVRAVPAVAVDAADPGDAGARAEGEFRSRKPMMPAHSSGAMWIASRPSGMG